jgi:hypothetical protein
MGHVIQVGTEVLVAGKVTAISGDGSSVEFEPNIGSGKLALPNKQVLERGKVVIEAPEEVEGAKGTGLTVEAPE